MIEIKKANDREKIEAFEIAKELKEWFNQKGLENMVLDFEINNLAVAIGEDKVVGFVCYSSYSGKILLLWTAVKREEQGRGIGEKLLKWLEEMAKNLGLLSIEVETLSDEDDYEPYKKTRDFYYKNGFKKVLYKKAEFEGWDDQIVLRKEL